MIKIISILFSVIIISGCTSKPLTFEEVQQLDKYCIERGMKPVHQLFEKYNKDKILDVDCINSVGEKFEAFSENEKNNSDR